LTVTPKILLSIGAVIAAAIALLASLALSDKANGPSDPRIRAELRQGGMIVVFRHAVADASAPAAPGCARQANLTDEGRADALAIGAAFRSLDARVGSVLVSPLCRTQETARLAFPGTTPKVRDDLAGSTTERDAAWRRRIREVQDLLTRKPQPGTDSVLVTHSDVISATTGLEVGMGDAVVLRPLGNGDFTVVARLSPGDWNDLAAS
jgi:broad specificity phosphatase PhoE